MPPTLHLFAMKHSWLTSWGTIITSIITGLFGLAGLFVKSWLDKRNKSKNSQEEITEYESKLTAMQEYFKMSSRLYHTMNNYLEPLGASSIKVIKSPNSGGIPGAGHDIFTSLHAQVINPPAEKINEWDRLKAGQFYMSLLSNLATKGQQWVHYDDLPPKRDFLYGDRPNYIDDLLRIFYEQNKIKTSFVLSLYPVDTAFLYLSIGFPEHTEEISGENQIKIFEMAQQLSHILNEMEKLAERFSNNVPGIRE